MPAGRLWGKGVLEFYHTVDAVPVHLGTPCGTGEWDGVQRARFH